MEDAIMIYKLRFVQRFHKKDQELFLQLEKKFIELEKNDPQMPIGRRFVPVSAKEPTNTLIWEAEFPSLEAAIAGLQTIEGNTTHDALLEQQIGCMSETYTELYRELE
jgi:hypothetical protein